jgi:hypothetical protein
MSTAMAREDVDDRHSFDSAVPSAVVVGACAGRSAAEALRRDRL